MNIKLNLKSINPIVSYFLKKKSELENLKKNDKALQKKYLNFYENCLVTKIVHDCDANINFDLSENEDLTNLRKMVLLNFQILNFHLMKISLKKF